MAVHLWFPHAWWKIDAATHSWTKLPEAVIHTTFDTASPPPPTVHLANPIHQLHLSPSFIYQYFPATFNSEESQIDWSNRLRPSTLEGADNLSDGSSSNPLPRALSLKMLGQIDLTGSSQRHYYDPWPGGRPSSRGVIVQRSIPQAKARDAL
ncbi:hypothetical protein G7046_g2158 [Stylonectria norvegica]|nr:hypothetical protein G7046_g2158 [Stylonectria norvegica]